MDKKGYTQIIGAIIGILLIALIIFILVPNLTSPIELRINLQTNQIVQGQNGILLYRIINNKADPLYDVAINNSIIGKQFPPERIDELNTLLGKQYISGSYRFDTRYLEPGQYTIRTILTYNYKNKSMEEDLTLKFEVF